MCCSTATSKASLCAATTHKGLFAACGFDKLGWYRVAGRPEPHRLVVDRVGRTQDRGGGISSITMCSDDLKNGSTARLEVAMQYVLHGAPGGCGVINLVVFDGV